MAKHDQRWRRKNKRKTAEYKRHVLAGKKWEQMLEKLRNGIRKIGDWARLNGGFSRTITPRIAFSRVVYGAPSRIISQKYNGDGSYDITVETDVFRDGNLNEKVGTLIMTVYGATYTDGRIEVHGRNPECNTR